MIPNYSRNDPKGWGGDPRRGAALGRSKICEVAPDYDGRIYVKRIRLNSGGYDKNGTYFGQGPPRLYWVANGDGSLDYTLRARDRTAAVEAVKERFPKAKVRP